MRYKFVGHTADVEYVAYGKTIEECFRNSLIALFDTIAYLKQVRSSKSPIKLFAIKDKARSLEDLLWYALQDSVSLTDSKGLFAYGMKRLKITESNGYKIDAIILAKAREDRLSKLDVKGVSKYNLKVRRAKEGFEATVVLDV